MCKSRIHLLGNVIYSVEYHHLGGVINQVYSVLQGVNILVDIGADINFGENRDTPLCVAVRSRDKKMVECLLEHNVTNVNVREALKLSWELKLDFITGLLLEHISVDRNRDSVNLSGLELATVKPLWILPSLGVKTLPEEKQQHFGRHKKQRSLGHVKEFLNHRRKSLATESPLEMENIASLIAENKSLRRASVDLSSLKYVSDIEATSEAEEVDFGSTRVIKQNLKDIQESAVNVTPFSELVDSQAHKAMSLLPADSRPLNSYQVEDSGVETLRTVHSSESGLSESFAERNTSGASQTMSLGSLHRQRHGTVSGAASLPHCTLEQFTSDRKEEDSSISTISSTHGANADSTLSPAQLIRKYRKRPRKSGRHPFSESLGSSFSFQVESPVPVMYYADQLDGLQESITMLSPETSAFSPTSTSWSNTTGGPSDLSFSSDGLHISAREGVDYGAPIHEESSFAEQPNSQLIKMLDLSSNKLRNFNDLCYSEYGGAFLFMQLKEVSSFDLKQNKLSELVKPMMKVSVSAEPARHS